MSDADVSRIVAASRFEAAKQRALEQDAETDAAGEPKQFKGGEASFIYKGTNGRWRDLLTADDLALYEAAKARVLPPDCAAWLETGGEVPV